VLAQHGRIVSLVQLASEPLTTPPALTRERGLPAPLNGHGAAQPVIMTVQAERSSHAAQHGFGKPSSASLPQVASASRSPAADDRARDDRRARRTISGSGGSGLRRPGAGHYRPRPRAIPDAGSG